MHKTIILDGGMGQELIRRSKRELTPMWSADIMLNEPQLVSDLHLEFIESGADVITLNTYTATPQRLKRDASIDLLAPLHNAAISAARDAIARSGKSQTKIAACLPPLVASYHPDDSMPFDEAFESYQTLLALQADAADIVICETMSSIAEAKAACQAVRSFSAHNKTSEMSLWIAFSISDDEPEKLRGGDTLASALKAMTEFSPDAIILNCSRPESITAVLDILKSHCDKHSIDYGVYANGFTSVDGLYPGETVQHLTCRKDLSPEHYARYAKLWRDTGASIVGGCCEIGPAHIAALAGEL